VSDVIGWVLVAVAAVLFLIGYVRYRRIRDRLIRPDASAPTGATGRRVQNAVSAGRLPDDKQLVAPTRAVARQTVTNYPLRWKYAMFTYPGLFALCASLFAFVPGYALGVLVGAILVAAIVAIQARFAYRGARRIVATRK
jgi:hypothetical protein